MGESDRERVRFVPYLTERMMARELDQAADIQRRFSADDAGESPGTLSLHVPPGLDVSKLTSGTFIGATVKREDDAEIPRHPSLRERHADTDRS